MGCSPSSAGGCWFHSGSAVCRVLLSSCTTAHPRFRQKTSSARSIVLRCSTINCYGLANGSPIITSHPWGKCFVACCRWLRNSSIPSITALLMKAGALCTRQVCPDHRHGPAEHQKSNWPNFACSITCRSATWLGKPACVLRLAPPKQCSKAWCGRNGLLTKMFQMRAMARARSNLQSSKLWKENSMPISECSDTLAAAGGRISVEALRGLAVPRTTLATLVKRGGVEITEEPAEFTLSGVKARSSQFDFQLNAAQQDALKNVQREIAASTFSGILLHGVTGSGKTAVYLAAMKSVLDAGQSAILLVPEIGLTPAVAADLHQVFGDEVAILHSALSAQERAEQWHRIKRGETRMVVGTRSAVFAPVSDLALIIVDEEQDSSYKQDETPRYHARDVAVMRAKMANAVVVLGSATPSLESYFNAKKNKYALLELPDRVEQRPLPEVEIVEMRQEFQETGHEQVISRKLAEEIRERIEQKEQVMVLLNRRGYSPVVLCRACGKTLECKNCAIALTHHKRTHRMECHYCGHIAPVPKACVHCGSN